MKKFLTFTLLALLLSSSVVNADVLCVRKKDKTKANGSGFQKNFKTFPGDTCPAKFKAVVNTSSFQGPAGATGATGSDAPRVEITQAQNDPRDVLLSVASGGSYASNTFYKGSDIGTFDKALDSTKVKITVTGNAVLINNSDTIAHCVYQLRVNDKNSVGNTSSSYENFPPATVGIGADAMPANQVDSSLITMQAYFFPSAGTHTISIWVRGQSVDDCLFNADAHRVNVLVEEMAH